MDEMNTFLIFFYLGLCIALPCIFGTITRTINENKGYDGGFAWGFWLGWIGIIVVACREPAPVYYPAPSSRNYNQPASSAPGGWRCTCGRFHSGYVTSCACGQSKQNVLNPAKPAVPVQKQAIPAPAPAAPAPADESKTIEALKEYKDLLDSGIITQEEFEQKKKALLSR